jgi:thymidylate kinase
MRIIMIGCEYAGKTTLAAEMSRWLEENMGVEQFGQYRWHDHFELPFHEGEGPDADLEAEQVLAMTPTLLEKYSRYMIHYHMFFFLDNHHLLVNWYYADAVYAPLYYGYGGTDEYADRQVMARHYDAEVMETAPDTVLVLLKASPEVIRQRKANNPHHREILKDTDVETVLRRFEEEYQRSGLRRRFMLDTTSVTIEETFQEFLRKMEPHFTQEDRLAMLTHAHLARSDSAPRTS